MERLFQRPALSIGLLVILAVYFFGFQLGTLALTDPDETFYAQTAKEMVERNDWTTSYLYGKPQFEKPVMLYWLVEASYKIFGVNEFAARLPSAVFGLIGIVAMYLLGSFLFSRRAGLLSAVVLATNVEYIVLSRACVTDMVLSTFMLLGFLFFIYGQDKGRAVWYMLSAAAFALATLTKGPVAVLLGGAVIILYLVMTGEWMKIRISTVVLSAAVFLAVSFPWYFAMYKIHGKVFIDAFFGFQNITRFTVSEHKIGSQFYYNIPILLGGLFPWSIFLGFAFWYAFKNAFSRQDLQRRNRLIFILVWFFVIFIFFTISSTKLPTYIFPSFAALALLVGLVWDRFLDNSELASFRRWMAGSYCVLLIAIVVGFFGLYIGLRKHHLDILLASGLPAIFLAVGFFSSYLAFVKREHLAAFFLMVLSVAVFLGMFGASMLPDIERLEASREVGYKLRELMKEGDELGSESAFRPGVTFYSGRFAADVDRYDSLVNFLNRDDKRVWAVVKEKNHRYLYEDGPGALKPSYVLYKAGKRTIVTNKVPDDGIYMMKMEKR